MDKAELTFEVDAMLGLLRMELDAYATLLAAANYRKAGHSQYYAVYDTCCALLLTRGIRVERHEGAQSLIALHYVKPGALPRDTTARINHLMGQRHAIDYRAAVDIGYREIADQHEWAIGFVRACLKLVEQSKVHSKQAVAAVLGALQNASALPEERAAESTPRASSKRPTGK